MNQRILAFRHRLRSKWAIGFAAAILLYTLVGFFLVPWIIKSQMLKRLPPLTHRAVTVQQVKFNPYALSLTIRGFALTETNGDTFVAFDEFHVNLQISSIFHRAFVFGEISLKKPFGSIIYRTDGTFNFSNLASDEKPKTAPEQSQALPRVLIGKFAIEDGAVAFTDLTCTTPFQTRFTPINIHLTDFTTVVEKGSPYSVVVQSADGESFSWTGDLTIRPLHSAGTFKLAGLPLKKYAPYLHEFAKFQVADGRVDMQTDYRYDSARSALDFEITKASVNLSNLQLTAPGNGEPLLVLPKLTVSQVSANLASQTVRVAAINISSGSVLVRLNPDRTLNWLTYLSLPPKKTATTAPTAVTTNASKPWLVNLDEFRITDFTVNAEDLTHAKPAKFTLDQLAVSIQGVSLDPNAPVTAAASFRCNQAGTVTVDGKLLPFKSTADLQVQVIGLDLRPFQPFVEDNVRLAVTSGALTTKGRIRYAEPQAPLIQFTGDVALAKFDCMDTVSFQNFLKWDTLNVNGIALNLQPNNLQIDEVKFTTLKTSIIILTNRALNVVAITASTNATPAPTAPVASTTNAATTAPFPVTIGVLAFDNATFGFTDQSITPNVAAAIDGFSGTVKGLTTMEPITADVDLKGAVDGHSPFAVTGTVSPVTTNLFLDLAIDMKNTDLAPASPYFGKYAGYILSKGKLSLDLKYNIKDKALQAQNKVRVDQLKLGTKSDSPDATKLPVKLAIALLQDRQGVISLDVPVTGRLDDPKFRLGPIIMQVLMNILTKAVTKPFALIGALFGGGEELSFITFAPGTADIVPEETKKLTTLTTALYERPGLSLEITGEVDPVKDRAALTHTKLEQRLKARFLKELTATNQTAVALETLKLELPDHDRLVKAEFISIFGTNALQVTASTNAAGSVAGVAIPSQPGTAPTPAHGPQQNFGPGREAAPLANLTTPATKPTLGTRTATTGPVLGATIQLSVAEMEAQLLEKIDITNDDFRALMQDRARKIQNLLLQSGKVTDDRLYLIAPKSVDAAYQGQTQASFSLQ